MKNCLFEVRHKRSKKKTKVYGIDSDTYEKYFLIWHGFEFQWANTKDFEPVPEVEEDKNC